MSEQMQQHQVGMHQNRKLDKEHLLKDQKIALIGLILPLLPAIAYASLVLLAFLSNTISSIIAADKLILLTVGLSPVIFILGTVVSITALFKSEPKKASLTAVALNIVLLTALAYFSPYFLAELKLVI